jgi:D-alanyl-D-alanine carboxypeptidase
MDAIARVEARIVDVQSRFAQFAAVTPTATRPAERSAAATTSSAPSFRSVVDAIGVPAAGTGPNSAGAMASLSMPSALSAVRTATSGAPGGVRAPGTFGAVTLPTELAGQRNGALPDSLLEPIGQGDHRLTRSAAVAFRRMAAAAQQQGITLSVSDAYRTVDEQEHLAGTLGLYREGGLAAVPGTSTHGWGLSVDLDVEPRSQAWLRANAARFGFAEDVAREPWHYTYRPADL